LHTPLPLINFKGQLGIHSPIKGFFLSFVPPKERKRKKNSWLGGSLTQHQLIPLHQKNSSWAEFFAPGCLFILIIGKVSLWTQTVFAAVASFVGWVPSCAAKATKSIVSGH